MVSVSHIFTYQFSIKYVIFLKTDGRIKVREEHDPVSPGKVLPSITAPSLNTLH